MGNSTARDRSRIQAEGESESGACIEAPPSADVADVGITRDVSFLRRIFCILLYPGPAFRRNVHGISYSIQCSCRKHSNSAWDYSHISCLCAQFSV